MPHADPADADQPADDVEQARAREYALLSTLLTRSPDGDLIARLARLRGDESALGAAHTALGEAAAATTAERVAREYFELFVGLGRGEVLPYASYYLTGFLHGRPLAALRQTLRAIGVACANGETEPEDHAAILFEIMAGLAVGTIPAPAGTDRALFETHLAPWIGGFFADLEQAKSARFYARVGSLGGTFMEIETAAFGLTA